MTLQSKKLLFFPIKILAFIAGCFINFAAFTQDVKPLLQKVKAKLDQVNDYEAEGKMKTDVAFIKAPASDIKIFYKRPDKFKLKRSNGIFLLPKGGVAVNMSTLLANGDYLALDAGESVIGERKVKVVKLLPTSENSDIVLTTLYIDEANLLIMKTSATTKENGTYETEMSYGKYAQYGLPDKVIFFFNTKDFKLPKGLTMEFDDGEKTPEPGKMRDNKGKIEILYSAYIINKGVPDEEFK